MKSLWTAGAVILALTAAAASPQGQDELKKMFPDIEGVKKSPRKLSKEARERVEKAIEGKLDDRDAFATIWEGRATVVDAASGEKARVLYLTLAAKGPKGDFKLGVAIAPDDRVVAGVRVLENKDDPAVASDDFLVQFEGFHYSTSLANPASMLAEARNRVADRKDEKARHADGIFKLMSIMHPVQTAWWSLNRHLDKGSKEAAADAEEIIRLFGETEKVLPDFTFLKASQIDSFKRRLKESSKELGNLAQHARAGKMVEARRSADEVLKMSCTLCHAGNARLFREKRLELGIGNGYFSVGHDVKVAEGPRESFEAVAGAIRKAVLILNEAK
jgi:ribosomal protein L44E